MKIRHSFVTNSSSSSYVCNVCSEAQEQSTDDELEYWNIYTCEKDHTFCKDHMSSKDQKTVRKIIITAENNNAWEEASEAVQSTPSKFCPICNMTEVSRIDSLMYACKKAGFSENQLRDIITDEFGSYEEFNNYINNQVKKVLPEKKYTPDDEGLQSLM